MSKIATDLSSVTKVAVDLAKHVFQIHAVDAVSRPSVRDSYSVAGIGGVNLKCNTA